MEREVFQDDVDCLASQEGKRAKANLSLSFQAVAAVGGTSPGGDFDDNDDGPVWHAEFDLAPRIDQLPRHVEAAKAMRVSGAR